VDYDAGFGTVPRLAGQGLSRLANVATGRRARRGDHQFIVYVEAYTRWADSAAWSVLAKSALLSGHTEGVRSVAFGPDHLRVCGRDDSGTVLAWAVKDGLPNGTANSPPWPRGPRAVSPDRGLRAEGRNDVVVLLDRVNDGPRRDYARRLVLEATNRIPWHQQRAAQAEKDEAWFAAPFHLGRLLGDKPDEADLKRRRDQARDKLKTSPPMEPLPR
jgi:hypothetical protein